MRWLRRGRHTHSCGATREAGTATKRPATGPLQAAAAASSVRSQPPAQACQQSLALNYFFDGTGNNIDADVGTMQHSNVARLFQAMPDDSESRGLYSYYVYGLGTYFKEIGDPGDTSRGKGMGHMGQDRIDWAMRKFDEAVSRAEKRAQNPTNKICSIKVSVFGFSRGSALARAFVRDLAKRCKVTADGYRLTPGGYPVEVLFLGLFDTVASVGLPMSGNNTPLATSLGWYSVKTTVDLRAQSPSCGIRVVAFGEPGADPAPGTYDGHATWADGLKVDAPGLVKRCVHMVAGHEIRNSFPVDSTLDGTRYPSGVSEMVYPGAHSNVGGGYQPGEGARSGHYGEVLSLIPLRAMHALAREAGVPLLSLDDIVRRSDILKRSFAVDAEGAAKFAELLDHYNHYMAQVGPGGRQIGQELLVHMHWYNRWRFFNIRRNQQARQRGQSGPDAAVAEERERSFAAERARMKQQVSALQAESSEAEVRLSNAQQALQNAKITEARYGLPVSPELQRREAMARNEAAKAKDRYLSEKAKLDTYADDSKLPANLKAYDERLMEDVRLIRQIRQSDPFVKLRPHYQNLLSAFQDEFIHGTGLRDPKVIAFFDRYVHDSLAGFAMDSTLPSDPRVVYAGGDNKIRYASVDGVPTEAKAA